MAISQFGVFVISTFVLNITPGNDFIFVATQSIRRGTRAGIVSAFGISLGLIVHILGSVLGLSLLLAKSVIIFEIIKWLGAAYLIYLGINSILSKVKNVEDATLHDHIATKKLLEQGFITNVFNPKVALFFLSFLPQFADASSPNFSYQLLLLGGWFIFSGTIVSIGIAILFSRLRTRLLQFKLFWKIQNKITGLVFICLGLKFALSQRK